MAVTADDQEADVVGLDPVYQHADLGVHVVQEPFELGPVLVEADTEDADAGRCFSSACNVHGVTFEKVEIMCPGVPRAAAGHRAEEKALLQIVPRETHDNSMLDDTLQLGPLRTGNRWCIHPMEGWDANRDGSPSELTLRRWRNFGLSGAKLIWGGEAVAVRVGDSERGSNALEILAWDSATEE